MAPFKQSEFAALTLTSDHEKQFNEWVTAENMNGHDAMQALLEQGFKLSISWVLDQSAFCFSVIGTDATKKHQNMVMTSWSDDMDEVACIALFKHAVICGGDTWPTRHDGPRWG